MLVVQVCLVYRPMVEVEWQIPLVRLGILSPVGSEIASVGEEWKDGLI
jgi:hypothetical protein